MSRVHFRRGNYSVLAAFGLPVILGFAAIAIDMSRIQLARSEVKMAAESIAHSALISMKDNQAPDVIRKIAKRTGQHNSVDGDRVNVHQKKDIVFGNWDFETKTWTPSDDTYNSVKVVYGRTPDHQDGPLDMLITPFMGVDYVSISEETSSIAAFRPRDLCIAMDVPSFAGEMPQARKAALALLDNEFPHHRRPGLYGGFRRGWASFHPLSDVADNESEIVAKWNGTHWGKSGPVTTEKQWYYQKPGRYWGWTGKIENVWMAQPPLKSLALVQ